MPSVNILIAILVFTLGLIIGSFLNVCVYRIPRQESIVFPASHCPDCGKKIKFWDNIPILSFLLLKGRCRFCGKKISIRYPLIELLTATLLLLLFLKYHLTLSFLTLSFFACVLIMISAIDLEHLLIPNKIILPSIMIGFLFMFIAGYERLLESLLGFIIGGGVLLITAIIAPYFLKQEGLGGGDIKLAAFTGIFLGRFVLMALFWGFLLGGLAGLVLIVMRNKKLKDPMTFGPFLSSGALLTLLFGTYFWAAYLGLIGIK